MHRSIGLFERLRGAWQAGTATRIAPNIDDLIRYAKCLESEFPGESGERTSSLDEPSLGKDRSIVVSTYTHAALRAPGEGPNLSLTVSRYSYTSKLDGEFWTRGISHHGKAAILHVNSGDNVYDEVSFKLYKDPYAYPREVFGQQITSLSSLSPTGGSGHRIDLDSKDIKNVDVGSLVSLVEASILGMVSDGTAEEKKAVKAGLERARAAAGLAHPVANAIQAFKHPVLATTVS